MRMATVYTMLGPHAYILQRYGISPHDDITTAVEKLKHTMPHLARLLKEIAIIRET